MVTFDDRVRDARMAMKMGNLQGAMDAYNTLIGEQPQAPQLYFERGLVAHLGQAGQLAERDYRTALSLDPTHLKARENLGHIARKVMPFVGPTQASRSGSTDDPFVYVVGSSYVRSFSASTLFLPLWLGPANELSFLNDERAARTTAHLFATLDRCDLRNPVLLVMGNNDPINHADNLLGTKDLQAKGELGSHAEVVEAAAMRYAAAIEAILGRYPGIRLLVLGGCVMFARENTEYARISNRALAAQCKKLGVNFIDINDDLVDPENGLLRVDRASYHDNAHLSKGASVELVGKALTQLGLLPTGVLPFEWSFLWQAPLSPDFVVRIWGEPHTGPSNLVHSRTVAFNHVIERALHVLLGTLAIDVGSSRPSVLVPYCREGFVPLSLPIAGVSRVTGLDPDEASVVMARRLADYFGRAEIEFRRFEKGVGFSAGVEPHDYVFVALRGDEGVGDGVALLDECSGVGRKGVIVLSTLDWSSLAAPSAGSRLIFPVADATTRPPWDAGTILIQQKG